MSSNKDPKINKINRKYNEELILHHVSGRLKVAPEHTSDRVLNCMRKPSFSLFYKFKKIFDELNIKYDLHQQLIPYFISSHPACTEEDMAELAAITKKLNFHLEQVQDFTPTPMTVASEIYYTGYHPYTMEKIHTAKTPEEKQEQRKYFFWYKPEYTAEIRESLAKLNRYDIIKELFGSNHRKQDNKYSNKKK